MILKIGKLRVNDHPAQMEAIVHASEEVRFCGRVEEGDLCVGTARVGAGGICATRPAGAGGGAGLSVQDDRQVDAADHAIHPAVPADGGGAGRSVSAAALCQSVHGGGRAVAGAGGPGARAAEWAGTLTTDRSSSITGCANYWRNWLSNSPSRGRCTRPTMRWWKARTEPSSASTWGTAISPASTPRAFRISTSDISTRISTFIGRAVLRR